MTYIFVNDYKAVGHLEANVGHLDTQHTSGALACIQHTVTL